MFRCVLPEFSFRLSAAAPHSKAQRAYAELRFHALALSLSASLPKQWPLTVWLANMPNDVAKVERQQIWFAGVDGRWKVLFVLFLAPARVGIQSKGALSAIGQMFCLTSAFFGIYQRIFRRRRGKAITFL